MQQLPVKALMNNPIRRQIRRIADPYIHLLEDSDPTDSEAEEKRKLRVWVEQVESINPEDARHIRKLWGISAKDTAERDYANHHCDRSIRTEEIMAEVDALPWKGVKLERFESSHQTPKTFANFSDRPNFPAVKEAQADVEKWVSGNYDHPMLTIAGVPGTGKTHLAEAAGQALKERGEMVFYRTEGELVNELQRRISDNSTQELIKAACDAPWVIIDDMGVPHQGNWTLGIIDQIIGTRYVHAQQRDGHTLLTTNLMAKDMTARVARRLSEPGVSKVKTIKADNFYKVMV